MNIKEEIQKEIAQALEEHWAGAANHPKALAGSIYRIVLDKVQQVQDILPDKDIFSIVISYTNDYEKTVRKLVDMLREMEVYTKIILTSPEVEEAYKSDEIIKADIYIDLNDQIEDESYFDRFKNQKETTHIIGIGFTHETPDVHTLYNIGHSFYSVSNEDIKQVFLQEYIYNLIMSDYII